MSKSRKGFTLIELLVVIAIIAILAAILFPVFAQAKLAAKKAADLSNMKQIGTSIAIYLSDSDDTYPMLETWSDNWAIYPANGTMWSSVNVIGPYTKNYDIQVCPIDKPITAPGPTDWHYLNMPTTRPFHQASYLANSMNIDGAATQYGVTGGHGLFMQAGWWGATPATSATEAAHPSQLIMLANGVQEIWGNWLGGSPLCDDIETDACGGYNMKGVYDQFMPAAVRLAATTDPTYLAWRKFSGKANFTFADTHSKSMSPDQVDNATSWISNAP